ncbi:flavin reductase [Naumannella cuiyingiana]|uniref:Flavin reductase (DIM6/NTAB) family NADH-FMN oxidoreductase RutF n=1 Tax=Naumannella cuiyingiana TaxID=1347891 RepID=A0A7Z0IM91_9ACTN|nr:flavin reductase (DIM6/NTAB) family NADH-FMN oxidoreductase RutF [Naumannella cuiyingiana]
MSIHADHPFLPPDDARDPLRRLRGRLAAPVTVWTIGAPGQRPEGWTLSSVLIADGDPPEVLGLLDPDSELADALPGATTATVNVLAEGQAAVAEAFARVAPAPGGPFRTGEWLDDAHGPRLAGAAGWLGVRLMPDPGRAGYALLLRGVVETAQVGGAEPLFHLRGRYLS